MMLPSRLGCPLSLKTPNMGNPGTKYSRGIAALGMTPEQVARDYNVALRITPTKMRGH